MQYKDARNIKSHLLDLGKFEEIVFMREAHTKEGHCFKRVIFEWSWALDTLSEYLCITIIVLDMKKK